jgi:hypothetical protein
VTAIPTPEGAPVAEKLRVREPGKHALLNPVTGLHESPGWMTGSTRITRW